MTQHFCAQAEDVGVELDEYLCRQFPRLRKRDLRALVRSGSVTVNGAPATPSQRLRVDDVISCELEQEDDLEGPDDASLAQDVVEPLAVLYEDEHVLVIDKPADLLVEPDRWETGRPNLLGRLRELARRRAEQGGQEFRPRLVHRLDKDTSGCMVVAKTVDAERVLGRAFEGGGIRKRYLALVEGEHPAPLGERELIDLPIGPDGRRSGQMSAQRDGKSAQTVVRVRELYRGYSLMECEPLTGRTHQIRVHLAAQGFPLVVDPLYGRRKALMLSEIKPGYRRKPGQPELPLIGRLTLHAESLELPRVAGDASATDSTEPIRVRSPLPRDFERALKQLAKWRPARR